MSRLSGQVIVIAVGKLRTPHWQQAQDTYRKRLQRYTRFELIEVKDAVGRGLPDAAAMQKEGELLLKAAVSAARLIALTPTGTQMSSTQLAAFLQQQVQVFGRLAFLIGGPLGFSDEVLVQCHEQLSLSPLTFPHELARVILLEQLYRACTILNHEPYHK